MDFHGSCRIIVVVVVVFVRDDDDDDGDGKIGNPVDGLVVVVVVIAAGQPTKACTVKLSRQDKAIYNRDTNDHVLTMVVIAADFG